MSSFGKLFGFGAALHREMLHLQRNRAIGRATAQRRADALAQHPSSPAQSDLDILFGVARGTFRERGDAHAFFGGDIVGQMFRDASQGTVMYGAMGGGKTAMLRSIAEQLAHRCDLAVVAMSAKPDDAQSLVEILWSGRHPNAPFADGAKSLGCTCENCQAKRRVYYISPGFDCIALFRGLTPARIGATFGALAEDPTHPFWGASVEALVTAYMQLALGLEGESLVLEEQQEQLDKDGAVVVPYSPAHTVECRYSATSLADMIYAEPRLFKLALKTASQRLQRFAESDPPRAGHLESALRYFTGEFQQDFADRNTLGNVLASLKPYLRPLTQPGIAETFGDGDLDIPSALDLGHCLIFGVNQAENPKAFEVVCSLVLAHLHAAALARTGRDPAQNNPVVLLADEYGSYASPKHTLLWETCRQAVICPYVSVISLTNFAARVGEKAARSLPASFGSLLCFRTGDAETRRYVTSLIGTIENRETSTSTQIRGDANVLSHVLGNAESTGTSERIVDRPIVADEIWSHLGIVPEHDGEPAHARCVAVVMQGGRQYRDVVMIPESIS